MSAIACPHCGAQYDLAQVGELAEFQCGACSQVVSVPKRPAARQRPQAAPSAPAGGRSRPARGARSAPTREAPPARGQRESAAAARGGRRRGGSDDDGAPDGSKKGLLIGGAVVAVLVVVGLGFALSGSKDASPEAQPLDGTTGGSVAETSTGTEPKELTPAEWKALPESERKSRATARIAAVDPSDETAVRAAVEFFRARGDDASVELLARRHMDKVPQSAFAREVLGVRDMRPEIERAFRECEDAYMADAQAYLKLRELLDSRASGGRAFVPDVAEVAEIEGLITELRRVNDELKDPYKAGARHWVQYQSAIEVIRDYPAVHELSGPYLIFAQVDVPKGTKLEDAPPEKVEAARKTVAENVVIFNALYEGWMKHIAPMLGMQRYGPENCDKETLFKVNIFPDRDSYAAYNRLVGGPDGSARAYYSLQEPRFVCTYVGDKPEDVAKDRHVQCHEATHQLVHFYTWDLTRKKTGSEPNWLQCRTRHLWSTEGFAEFFASHTYENGEYRWMQPLDERMCQIKIFDEIIAMKDWTPWRLVDLLRPTNGLELQLAGDSRGKKQEDAGIAVNVFANQFYGKAWSLVYYLWYAEKDGKLRYRDKLAEFMKLEFYAEILPHGSTKYRSPGDFRRMFGLEDDAALARFETEWQAFEKALIAKHDKPAWKKERDRLFELYGLDK